MPRCQTCGDTVSGPSAYTCSYCGTYSCASHKLPENHNCPYVSAAQAPETDHSTSWHGVRKTGQPIQNDESSSVSLGWISTILLLVVACLTISGIGYIGWIVLTQL